MTLTRMPFLAAGALLALSAMAPSGHAQAVRGDASARAEQLHRQATSLAEGAGAHPNSVGQFRKAARLHMHSAVLRPAHDPQATGCLQKAAHLLHGSDPAQASALMESAGEHAHARGDVVAAARSFADAASIVVAQRRVDQAQHGRAGKLIDRARLLASSPLLTDEDRASIVARVEPAEQQLRVAASAR